MLSIAGRDARLRGRSFTPFYGASFVAAKARATGAQSLRSQESTAQVEVVFLAANAFRGSKL